MIRIAAAIVALIPCMAIAGPHDWPQWRGPNRDGVSTETGLLKSWPEDGPPVLWVATELGGGYSTPSVANGRVFGMSYRGADEVVWALDEKTGKELWARRIAAKGKAGYNEGPRSTPTADGDKIFAVGISGDLACLRAATGEPVWAINYVRDLGGRMMSGWGFSESVLVDGNHVICTPGADKAALAAIEKSTGKIVWTTAITKCGGAGYSSPIRAEVAKRKMYVTLLGKTGGAVAVCAKDGKLLWQYLGISNATANIPTVVYRDGFLACSTGYRDGGFALLKLTADEENCTFEEMARHEAKAVQNHHGGMVLVGDHLYFGRGHGRGLPTCVAFKTGAVVWQEDRAPGSGSAAVTFADGMLYLRYEDGTVALIDATPKSYRLVSSFVVSDRSGKPHWPHPVVANGKLLIRDQDRLTCYNVKAAR